MPDLDLAEGRRMAAALDELSRAIGRGCAVGAGDSRLLMSVVAVLPALLDTAEKLQKARDVAMRTLPSSAAILQSDVHFREEDYEDLLSILRGETE